MAQDRTAGSISIHPENSWNDHDPVWFDRASLCRNSTHISIKKIKKGLPGRAEVAFFPACGFDLNVWSRIVSWCIVQAVNEELLILKDYK